MNTIPVKFLIFTLVSLSIFACNKNEPQDGGAQDGMINSPNPGAQFCLTEDLPFITDGQSCDLPADGFICEILEIEETMYIDEEAYDWSPGICELGVGTQLTFRNQENIITWDVVENSHHITQERVYVSCNENYEKATYICQKNEVISASFLCDVIGPDTLMIEIRTAVYSYMDQSPGEKLNIINLSQDRNNSNIRNFWLRHFIGDEYSEGTWQSYLKEVILDGKGYKDVVRYQYGDNILAVPHTKYYLQKDFGILAFEVNGKLWIRD